MKTLFTVLLAAVIIFAVNSTAEASPPKPGIIELAQPDGTTFKARLLGNDNISFFETAAGFTVIKNADGWWRYATADKNGNLRPGGAAVDEATPQSGLKKHLRPKVMPPAQVLAVKAQEAAEPADPAITGNAKVLVILIDFPDKVASTQATYFDTLLFASQSGSMRDYYSKASLGQLDVTGAVAKSVWMRADNNMEWYGKDDASGNHDNGNVVRYTLAQEAVQKLDAAGFDFSPYDTDGDGFVDHVFIVHAGYGQEDSNNADSAAEGTNQLWSYTGYIGGSANNAQTVTGGLKVFRFTLQAEYSTMGVFAHEFFHDLGGPDIYDTSTGQSVNGNWSLMDHGLWAGEPAGSNPVLPGAYLMWDIDGISSNGITGWMTSSLSTLVSDGSYTVTALASDSSGGTRAYKMNIPGQSQKYFIIENRYKTGYDLNIPEQGLLIWEVDESNLNNAGSPYLVELVDASNTSTYPPKQGAAYSADDNQTIFSNTSTPSSGSDAVNISNVGSESVQMTFSYSTTEVVATDTTSTSTAPAPTGDSSSGGGCFLATSAYEKSAGTFGEKLVRNFTGQYSLPARNLKKLNVLRKFRDDKLMSTKSGRAFVRAYYTLGPVAAEAIRNNEPLKRSVRDLLLKPLVKTMNK